MTARRKPKCRAISVAMTAIVVFLASSSLASPAPPFTQIVSVTASGEPGNGESQSGLFFDGGRSLAFPSRATNLVEPDGLPSDEFGFRIYLRDLDEGKTEVVVSEEPIGLMEISEDGRVILFEGLFQKSLAVYAYDVLEREVQRIPAGFGTKQIGTVRLSADGRYVAFYNSGPLVPEDTNGAYDVYVYDRETGTRERVSVASDGSQVTPPFQNQLPLSISSDGRYVAFQSSARELMPPSTPANTYHIFIHDRTTGTTVPADLTSDGRLWGNTCAFSMSSNGRYVLFPNQGDMVDTGTGTGGIFLHDMITGRTERVSVLSDGWELFGPSNGYCAGQGLHVSDDGRFVSFGYYGDLPDGSYVNTYFVRDRELGLTTDLATRVDIQHGLRDMTSDGRYVAGAVQEASSPWQSAVAEVGAGVGTTELQATVGPEAVEVDGTASFAGHVLAAAGDPEDDGISAGPVKASDLEAELTHARVIVRPEQGDLFLEADRVAAPTTLVGSNRVSTGGPGPGHPGLVYEWSFAVGGVPYRVEAMCHEDCGIERELFVSGPIPERYPTLRGQFILLRCDPACTLAGTLSGGFATIGDRVVVSVPLAMIGGSPGAPIGPMRLRTVVAADAAGATTLDEMILTGSTLPGPTVRLGIAPAGTPFDEVEMIMPAAIANETFSGSLSLAGLSSGRYDVWGEACVGSTCGASSTEVTVETS